MKTEEKPFMTMEEAATYLNRKRATVYNFVRDLNIKTHKFKRDRHAYLALADVKRIKEAIEKPWTVGEEISEEDQTGQLAIAN